MRLIITEKNNSADKISKILSSTSPSGKRSEDKAYAIPVYRWTDDVGEEQVAIGLKGHVMNPAFPEEYKSWRGIEPRDLIDAKLIKVATQKNVVKALKKYAKTADSIVVATDYDREGELIGLEVLEELFVERPDLADHVTRARYSALTKEEIEHSFGNLVELSEPLARAGEARQDIDLIWGATLTRFVSLAAGRLGSSFLSVGRVQSPTLMLIVEREMERRAHVPQPFWEVYSQWSHPEGEFTARHVTEKFMPEDYLPDDQRQFEWKQLDEDTKAAATAKARTAAEAAVKGTTNPGVIKSLEARKNTRQPPTPFNTTAFTSAASNIGITPARAMRIAEDLYMDGFISYPRTDNTVYPPSLPVDQLVRQMVSVPEFKAAAYLLDKPLQPTRGKKETTDHPPIHPTQAINPAALEESKRKIYELVVRRFLATFMEPAVSESTRANIECGSAQAGSETYFIRGNVLVEPGFVAIYPYGRRADEELPKLEEGQELTLAERGAWSDEKETQPPARIGQGKLIEMMEERGLGTKATRHDIIQKLYDRGYVHGSPPEPTETGIAMAKAFREYASRISTPDMTAELEVDMDKIANGEISKEEVVAISRRMLHEAYDGMEQNKEDLARTIWDGMNADRILGPCWKCRELGRKNEQGEINRLRIIRARKSGKRFVGCEGWKAPDEETGEVPADACDVTFGIPQRGELIRLEEVCSICGKTPRVKVIGSGFQGRGRPWNLCLNDDCESMREMREKRAAREAAQAAKEAEYKAECEAKGIEYLPPEERKKQEAKTARAEKAAAKKDGTAAKPAAKKKAPARKRATATAKAKSTASRTRS